MTVTLETRDFFYPKINGGNEKKKNKKKTPGTLNSVNMH